MGNPQLGITTPRGSGNAVKRNRVKRIMRETYRHNRSEFPARGKLVYVVKKCGDWEEIKPEMILLSKKVQEQIRINKALDK